MTTFPISAGTDDTLASEAGEPDVPFSPPNRMKTFVVLAMLIDSIIVIGGVVWLQKYARDATSTPLSYAIIAFGGLGLKELLAMLHTHNEAQQTRGALGYNAKRVEEIAKDARNAAEDAAKKVNGGLQTAVKEVAEQVRAAERDQVAAEFLNDPRFDALVERVVERTCAKLDKGGDKPTVQT